MSVQSPRFSTEAAVFEKLTNNPNPDAVVAAFEAELISEQSLFKLLPKGHPILVQSALKRARAGVQRLMGTTPSA